jgi:hypothetical protein
MGQGAVVKCTSTIRTPANPCPTLGTTRQPFYFPVWSCPGHGARACSCSIDAWAGGRGRQMVCRGPMRGRYVIVEGNTREMEGVIGQESNVRR